MKKQSRAKNSPPKITLVAAGSANSVECLLASLLASRDCHSLAEVTVCRTLQVAIPGDEAKQRSLVCPGVLRQVLNKARPGHFTVSLWESRERAIAIRRRCAQPPRLHTPGQTHQGSQFTNRTGSAYCRQLETHPTALPILKAAFNMGPFRLHIQRCVS
jgi:hypothetical protein